MDSNAATTTTSVTAKRRVRVEYSAGLANKIDELVRGQNQLAIQLSSLQASIMPRHEIDSELEKRVMIGTYIADKTALEQRVKDLEEAPQSVWSRASILVSSGLGCLSLLIGSSGAIIAVISIIVNHPLK